MADPETDRRDVNEAEEAFRRLVVAGRDTPGVLELARPKVAFVDEVFFAEAKKVTAIGAVGRCRQAQQEVRLLIFTQN